MIVNAKNEYDLFISKNISYFFMKFHFILLLILSVIIAKGQTDTSTVLIQEVVITTQRNPQESINIP